jgi:hypothetical protein
MTKRYHVYIIGDKAMKVRMLHCELKWEIPTKERLYFDVPKRRAM